MAGKMEDFPFVNKTGKTGVFWDAVSYPFPTGMSPDVIYTKIESTLCDADADEDEDEDEDWDCMGEKSIWVYVDETKGPWGGDFLKNMTWKSRIYFLPGGGDKSARRNRMLHDIHLWSMDFAVMHPRPSYLVVVSDQVTVDVYFLRTLDISSRIGYRVFLAAAPKSYRPENEVEWPASVLHVVYSFAEDKEVGFNQQHKAKKYKATLDGKDLEDKKKHLHIEDFSAIVQGGQRGVLWYRLPRENKDFFCYERPTFVFWNVKQCPIPSGVMLPGVVSNIESALYQMGFHSPVEIYAYGDKLDQKDGFRKANICYSVEGEHLRNKPIAKTQDYEEMAVDLINFATPTYERPAVLVVIPKPEPDSELHRVLKCLESRSHDVLVVKPPVDDIGGVFLGSAQSLVECTQGLDGGKPIGTGECICYTYD